jgi:hypothetical protein
MLVLAPGFVEPELFHRQWEIPITAQPGALLPTCGPWTGAHPPDGGSSFQSTAQTKNFTGTISPLTRPPILPHARRHTETAPSSNAAGRDSSARLVTNPPFSFPYSLPCSSPNRQGFKRWCTSTPWGSSHCRIRPAARLLPTLPTYSCPGRSMKGRCPSRGAPPWRVPRCIDILDVKRRAGADTGSDGWWGCGGVWSSLAHRHIHLLRRPAQTSSARRCKSVSDATGVRGGAQCEAKVGLIVRNL